MYFLKIPLRENVDFIDFYDALKRKYILSYFCLDIIIDGS